MNECVLEIKTRNGVKERYPFSSSRRMKKEYRKWVDFLKENSTAVEEPSCYVIEIASYSIVTINLSELEYLYIGWQDVRSEEDTDISYTTTNS